jgi:hypothetical protein
MMASVKPKGFPLTLDDRYLAVLKIRTQLADEDMAVVDSGVKNMLKMEQVNISLEELRMEKIARAMSVSLSAQAMTPEEIALQVSEMRRELGLDIKEIDYGTDRTIGHGVGGEEKAEDEGVVVPCVAVDGGREKVSTGESGGDAGEVPDDFDEHGA